MNPPGALQLGDAVALVASRALIGVADADFVAIYPGRAFGCHLDLHQSEDGQSGMSDADSGRSAIRRVE